MQQICAAAWGYSAKQCIQSEASDKKSRFCRMTFGTISTNLHLHYIEPGTCLDSDKTASSSV